MGRSLRMLDPLDEIRRLYFATTRETIEGDLERALDLLKRMASDEQRQRAAGFMHGLSDLRREWGRGKKRRAGGTRPAGQAPKEAGRTRKRR